MDALVADPATQELAPIAGAAAAAAATYLAGTPWAAELQENLRAAIEHIYSLPRGWYNERQIRLGKERLERDGLRKVREQQFKNDMKLHHKTLTGTEYKTKVENFFSKKTSDDRFWTHVSELEKAYTDARARFDDGDSYTRLGYRHLDPYNAFYNAVRQAIFEAAKNGNSEEVIDIHEKLDSAYLHSDLLGVVENAIQGLQNDRTLNPPLSDTLQGYETENW